MKNMDPVLVVEDDPVTAELIRRALKRENIPCTLVQRVDAASELVVQQRFSALLLDYRLEDGLAWPVLEAARASPFRPPVLMLTAMGDERVAAEALRRGASDYRTKSAELWSSLPLIVKRLVLETEVAYAQALVASVVESSADAIIASTRQVGASGGIVAFNRAAERMFGIQVADALGHYMAAFFIPSARDLIESALAITDDGVVTHLETSALGPEQLVEVSLTLSPIRSSSAEIIGALAVVRDITEQQRAKRELQERARLEEFQATVWRGLNVRSDFAGLYSACLEGVTTYLEAVLACIWIADDATRQFKLVAQIGATLLESEPIGQEVAQTAGQVATRKTPTVENAYQPLDELLRGSVAWAGCPFVVDGHGEGVLLFYSSQAVSALALVALQQVAQGLGQSAGQLFAQNALRESQMQLKRVIDGSSDGFWEWHVPSGRINYSPGWAQMLGFEVEDIVPTLAGWGNLVDPEDGKRTLAAIYDHWAGLSPRIEIEFRMRTRNAGWKWLLCRGKVASWLAPGRPEWMTGANVDIHERKLMEARLAESEATFKGIFDTMQDGYLKGPLDGPVGLANPAAARLLGFPDVETLRGSDLITLFQGLDLRVATASLWNDFRVTRTREDGSLNTLEGEYRITPPHAAVEIVFRDITEKTVADAERQARLGAETASRLKGEFLAHMSHEIRTPLNGILGLCHLTQKTELTHQQSAYLKNLHNAGEALLTIVNDILDFSKFEQPGELELERAEFSLEEILEHVIRLLSESACSKGIELLTVVEPGVPVHMVGDPGRLSQILTNLIGNAVKFTAVGEVVTTVSLLENPETVELLFQIRDTGPGIRPDRIGRLFAPFTQADSSTTRKFGGTGLGLAICKQLVRHMGGQIGVESAPGVGSTFTFSVKFAYSTRAPSSSVVHANLIGLRALVVDPAESSRNATCALLQRMGITAEALPSHPLALDCQRLQEPPFDLFYLDFSGSAATDRLEIFIERLQDTQPHPRVVLLTRQSHLELSTTTQNPNVVGVLSKPFTFSDLLDTTLTALGCSEIRREQTPDVEMSDILGRVKGVRVLLVEDNSINQLIAREILEQAGLEVTVVSNGLQAVEALSECPLESLWQVVLMDLQMPVMDGYTATFAIRRDKRFRDLPILAMTAHVLTEERDRCYACGMNGYISKPIDPKTMLATLDEWIRAPLQTVEKTASPPVQFPQLEGVQVSVGLTRLGWNASLYRALLLRMAEESSQTILELRAAAAINDFAAIHHLAHTLKGVAGSPGILTIEQQANDLEHFARSGMNTSTQNATRRLNEELQQISGLIIKVLMPESQLGLEVKNQCARPLSDSRSLQAAVAKLTVQLEKSDGAAAETLLGLRALLEPPQLQRTAALASFVESYDFERALGELRRVVSDILEATS